MCSCCLPPNSNSIITENLNLNRHIQRLLERSRYLKHLKQVQAFLITLGHSHTHFYAFKLVRFCALAIADLDYARFIFDHLPSPNTYLYTAMITAYASTANPVPALQLFCTMLRRGSPRPNHFVYPLALKSCSDTSAVGLTRTIQTHVLKSGFDAYHIVQTALIDSYCKCSDLETARVLFDEMPERNVVSWTAMISGYAKVGFIRQSILLFDDMPERDPPSWNAVIAGCTQNGLFSEAISLFQRMLFSNERPNERTVVCALSACAHLGMLHLGKWIHGYILKNNIGPSSFIANALLDMYGKCGCLDEAWTFFNFVSERSLTSWNTMINCLALHGKSESAISIFKEMESTGVEPDEVTFVGLLNACTHAGLVEEGIYYFDLMNLSHKIEPRIEHYGCMIDLLGRVGRFEEAMDVIRGMTIEPDEVVWGSLLNGSRVHGNIKLAEFSVQKLLEIDPSNAGYAVMLANIYSECGRWEEVGNIRKVLKVRGVQKTPGCSWIEVDKKVFQFYSADEAHPKMDGIYQLLQDLLGQDQL